MFKIISFKSIIGTQKMIYDRKYFLQNFFTNTKLYSPSRILFSIKKGKKPFFTYVFLDSPLEIILLIIIQHGIIVSFLYCVVTLNITFISYRQRQTYMG